MKQKMLISGSKKKSKCKKTLNNKADEKLSKNNKDSENNKPIKNLQLRKVKTKIKKKYREKHYSQDMVMKALSAITENGHTLRQAAQLFGVPKSTLHAKLNHHVPIECSKGAPTVLSRIEENEIVEWVLDCAERGFPVTKHHLLDCVQRFLIAEKRKNPFKDNRPGKQWYKGFMKRHDNLSQRMAQNLTSSRASVTESDLKAWFQSVKEYLKKKDLLNLDGNRIFNLDETAFMLVPKDNSVITRKGAKSVYQIVGSNEKACLTVLFTAAASGEMPPPMILFNVKTHPKKDVILDIPEHWGVGYSDSGWMTSETFYSYIVNVFYKWLLVKKIQFPIVLYVDGHSSHLTLPLMRFCKRASIEIVALYPNATHIIQPLDVALFHPLKESYKKTLRTWRIDNNIVDFKKHMFPRVLKLALDSIYPSIKTAIVNGFAACGLFPLDENAVHYDILNKKTKKRTTTSSSSSLSNDNENTASNNNYLQLLHLFEANITPNILQEFINNESEESWKGDIEQKGLFEFWLKLKTLCVKNAEDKTYDIVSENSISSENNSEALVIKNNFNNISDLSLPRVSSIELIEENSLSNDQICIEPSSIIQIASGECIEDNYHLPIIEVISDAEMAPINVESKDVHNKFNNRTTNDLFNTSKVTNSLNELNGIEFPISEEDLLNSNLCSTLTSTKDKSIDFAVNEYKNVDNHSLIEEQSSQMDIDLPVNTIANSESTKNEDFSASGISNADQISTSCPASQSSSNVEGEVTDSSIGSKTASPAVQKDEEVKGLKKIFKIPNFNVKTKMKKRNLETPPVLTRDDLLEVLEKKENEKILKEQQILQRKREKEKIKKLKETENNLIKDFKQCKKKLVEEKKVKNLEIKNIKKILKSETNKENRDQLVNKLKELSDRLDEIEKLLITYEMEALQRKMKIKQEKL